MKSNNDFIDDPNVENQLVDTLWENIENVGVENIKKIQINALLNKIYKSSDGKSILDDIVDSIYTAAKNGQSVSNALVIDLTQDLKNLLDAYFIALGFKCTDYKVYGDMYRVFW